MSLCVLAGGKTAMLAVSAFTLSWTHSIEKTAWEEDWRVTPAGIAIVEARVKGSGAGMEPPEGALLTNGWWAYRPTLPPQAKVILAASGSTGSGWKFCTVDGCRVLGANSGETVVISACAAQSGPR